VATPAQVPVSEYLRNIPARLRPTMQAARRTIKALAPKGTKEIAYRKWPIRYAVDDLLVCGVGDYPRWVAVYFFRGAELDDPDEVLEGTGKSMRHIKLREPKDASRPEVKRMMRRAFKKGGMTMRREGLPSGKGRETAS
jgi:hypothetical protein